MLNRIIGVVLVALALIIAAEAQSTEITYQGQLQSTSSPANGSFDFEFVLYDAVMGGSQIGSLLPRTVTVTNGIFSVRLDFGTSFPGATRFLEIHVRPANVGGFTTLSPRQPITSSPYSIKTLSADFATNASQLGGVAANQYLQNNGSGAGLTDLNAGSISTGTLNNARLGQIQTANLADNAVTAPKVATGQVVKGLNGLTDTVTLVGGSNVSVTPAGNTLTIATMGTANPILNQTTQQAGANFNIGGNGTVGGILTGNTVTAQTGTGFYGLRHTDGTTTVGSYVGAGSGGAFGGWLGTQTNSDLYLFTNNGQPRMTINTAGNVGIGSVSPAVRLDVNGDTVIRTGGTGGNIQLGTPNGETGMTIIGTNRADVRYDGSALRLFAGTGTGIPNNGLLITNQGNGGISGDLGIGTYNPDTRLTLNGGRIWTSTNWTASMNLRNGSAIGWDANPSGRRWGIAQGTAGLNFFRTFDSFGSNVSPADSALVMTNEGNITQPRQNNGLVKAMVFLDANGTILRCYNGMTNSSSGNCGFSPSRNLRGDYSINFGFQVSDRFVAVTAQNIPHNGTYVNLGTGFFFVSTNVIQFSVFTTDVDYGNSSTDNPIMIIIF